MKIAIPDSSKKILSIFFLRICGMIFGFLYIAQLTNTLGIEESGKYFFYVSIISIFLSISLFGLPTYFEQNLPKFIQLDNKSTLLNFLKSSLILSLGICFIVITVTIIFIQFKIINLEIIKSIIFYKFLIAIPIMTLVTMFSKIIQIHGKNIISVLISNFLFSFIFLISVFIFKPKEIDDFVNIFLGNYLFILMISIFFLPYKNFIKQNLKSDIYLIAKKSSNFFFIGIVYEYGMQLTTIFLGTAGNNSEISAYAICIKISSILSFALLAVHHFYISKFSASIDKFEKETMKNLIKKSLINLCLLALPIFFFILALRKNLLGFFGEEFIQFDHILIINLFAYFIYSIGGIAVMYLISARLEKKMLQNSLIIFLLASILNYLFIYKYGVVVGAIVFLFSNFFLTISNSFYVYKHYHLLKY